MADLLKKAATLLEQRDRLNRKLREKDEQLRKFCRRYEQETGLRGVAPIHLRTMIDYQLKKANL